MKNGLVVGLSAAVAALLLAALLGMRSSTPSIESADGTSVASLEWLELGGYRQAVLIRGRSTENPVLLFLHGGPGMPLMYLAHAFQRPLEEDFVVVQWDRRGAGKSYRDTLPPEALTVSALLSDAEELVEILRERFGREKIYLVGHSWGSYLGTLLVLRRPDLFHAYVGVGQVVDEERALELQRGFLEREAEKRGDDDALRQLTENGPTAHERWLFEYGGELAGSASWWPLLWTGLRAPEYDWSDVLRVGQGSSFSSRHMTYDVIGRDTALAEHVESYPIPAFFFTGRHDWTTPYPLIEEYFESIEAQRKELVWFEDSAHFPFFEEPQRFAREMRRVRGLIEQTPLR